jgi:hypothetical protein
LWVLEIFSEAKTKLRVSRIVTTLVEDIAGSIPAAGAILHLFRANGKVIAYWSLGSGSA